MKTIGMMRHQTIESLTSEHAEMTVDALIALWDQIAIQIILIVGEDGFDSLYARSVFLIQAKCPWLNADTLTAQTDRRFEGLRAKLQVQPSALAIEANRMLLVTLTDILASLIGESLTESILDSAWGVAAQIKAAKESHSET